MEKLPFPLIKALVESYYDFQSQRIMTQSRIKNNVERNQIDEKVLSQFGITEVFKQAESFEKNIKSLLEIEIKKYPITEWLAKLYGIGPIITAGLIANIENPAKFDKISSLWQYCGFGMLKYCTNCDEPVSIPFEFKNKENEVKKSKKLASLSNCPKCGSETKPMIQRRYTGYVSNWNDKAKVLCWKIGQSFEKQGPKSAYYNFYKKIKEEEKARNPEKIKENGKTMFNDGHIRNRALRKTIKLFLAHLWVVWREIEGLPVSDPYVGQVLNHNVIKPFIDNKKSK